MNKLILVIVLGMFSLSSCKTTKTLTPKKDVVEKVLDDFGAVYLFQDGESTLLEGDLSELKVKPAPFAIHFYNKRYNSDNKQFYAAQIAAFLDRSRLTQFFEGAYLDELEYVSPGTGMAPNESGKYESLLFETGGHHYLTYKDTESKRLNLLEATDEGLKLEFEINGLYYNGIEEKMSSTQLKEFYLVIVIDRNLNGKIEKGELNKLMVEIK